MRVIESENRKGAGEMDTAMSAEEQRETLRGMLRDWEAATPEQREAACKAAAEAAKQAGGA